MAKKNQEQEIHQLQQAIARIKDVKTRDSGDNPKFIEAIDMAEKTLLDQLFESVSQKIRKPKG